jgi:hypothetical protein
MATKNFQEFKALVEHAERQADENEEIYAQWWANNPPSQGWVPTFQRPNWDIPEALRLAQLYFAAPNRVYREILEEKINSALEPGPNDAHMGAPRW